MVFIKTNIFINAPIELVWKMFLNTQAYEDWNPFMVSVQGSFVLGQKLKIKFQMAHGKSFSAAPVVEIVDLHTKIQWHGKFFIPGLFDGCHAFRFLPENNGTRFYNEEMFSGLLIPFCGRILQETEKNFVLMNSAFKNYVES